MKRIGILLIVVVLVAAAWALFEGIAQQPRTSLAGLMPQEAVLYLEARDFGAMLREWDASPQKQTWLKSDNYEVFSRSRLLLRLTKAQQEFAAAAGIPPDMPFLTDVAGEQSALAIYDIGKLELLYITRLPSARAMNSRIWQQRGKFETREVAGRKFYVRTDADSERVVAFAIDNDLLILGTREDLVAGALTLVANQKAARLSEEGWFVDAVRAAKEPGEVRMVIHLAEVAQTPQFSTYWVQQNITEMRQYESVISDLFRGGVPGKPGVGLAGVESASTYREERTLLWQEGKKPAVAEDVPEVAELMRLVPPEIGFYRVQAAPAPADALALVETKVVTPRLGPAPVSKLAPSLSPGESQVGSASNLDVRIDVPPPAPTASKSDAHLEELITKANVRAILQLHRSEAAADGVFVRLRSTVVLSGAGDWNEAAAQSAIQQVLASGLTASGLGTGWRKAGARGQSYSELDGLAPVVMTVRGKYLFVSNDPATLATVLGQFQTPVSAQPAVYYAGFDHGRERQNFYQLTELVDRPSRTGSSEGREPQFFSQNAASLSRTFAAVKSQSIVVRRKDGIETQTVRYEWAQ